jgi:hypothetical protein
MKHLTRRRMLAAAPAALAFGGRLLTPMVARAKPYGPGVSDHEIKIGNTGPYSGPLANASPIEGERYVPFGPILTGAIG